MKKTLLLLAVLIWTSMQAVMAQTTVKGTVVDDKGETLPATSVRVKGTQIGVITSVDGSFEITIPEGTNPVLQVEAIGYSPKEITVKGDEGNLMVRMAVSASKLDDVMIIGYGQTTKEKYVGAADKIDAQQIEKFPVTDISRAIEGAAPGIQVANGGGPGAGASFRIRGIGSISASSAPLYVVDGSPYVGDITALNTDDIESITVLKDATATSLYGSRGANGVIMITTKRGKMGVDAKPRLSFKAQTGIVQRGLPDYEVLKDEKDYYEIAWEAYRNNLMFKAGFDKEDAGLVASGKIPGELGLVDALGGYNSYDVPNDQLIDPVTGKLNPAAKLRYHDDWAKDLMRTGIRHDYNLSVSGASDQSDYYMSFGYLKEDGYIKYSNYDRFTGRMNINTKINNWLKTGLNLSGALSNYNGVGADGSTAGGYNPFYASRANAPVYPVYYYDSLGNRQIDPITGEYKYDWGDKLNHPESSVGTRNTLPDANVLGSLALDQDKTRKFTVIAVPYLEAKFLKWFTFHTDINMNVYESRATGYRNPYYGQFSKNGGSVSKQNSSIFAYTWKQTLSFVRSFDKHNVNFLVNHENYFLKTNTIYASGTGLTVPGVAELANTSNPGEHRSYENNARIESYLANLVYDYDNKYFLSTSVRYDGSSRFSPKSRWGTPFWALGLGWNIDQESFMQDISWLDLLKVKASYGSQGNENTSSYYPWQSVYDLDYRNGSSAGGIVLNLGNPDLTWESSKQLNAGFEFSVFKRRLSGEFNYFIRTNADLIFGVPLPPSTGIVSILANTATMQNKGVELTLNADILRGSDFTWNTTMNFTHYTSVITKMPELAAGQDSILNGNYLWKKGHSIYDYYLLESFVDQTTGQEKYYYWGVDEDSNWVRKDTTSASFASNNGGRDYRGSSLPKLSGAMTNQFQYKGFDLSVLFTFSIGGKYYDRIYQSLMDSRDLGANYHKDILNRWTETNTNTDVPRLDLQNNDLGYTSTRFLIDGSYFNLRNVSLGYTFKPNWLTDAGFSNLRVSFSADNVLLLSKRRGMDPQGSFGGNPDYRYSPARTFVVGVNIGL